jgi:hypothetical protein
VRRRSVVVVAATVAWTLSLLPVAFASSAPQIIIKPTVISQAGGAAALVDVTTRCSGDSLPIDVTLYQGRSTVVAASTAYEVSAICDSHEHAIRIPVLLDPYDPYYESQSPSLPFASGPGVVVLGAGVGAGTTWPVQIVPSAPVERKQSAIRITSTASRSALGAVLHVAADIVCPASRRAAVGFDVAQQQGKAVPVNRFGAGSGLVRCTGHIQRVHASIEPTDRIWRAGPAFVAASLCVVRGSCAGSPAVWRTITVK